LISIRKDELDSFMYQTVGHDAIDFLQSCMGDIPLYRRSIHGASVSVESDYTETKGDEVEDLLLLLEEVKVIRTSKTACIHALTHFVINSESTQTFKVSRLVPYCPTINVFGWRTCKPICIIAFQSNFAIIIMVCLRCLRLGLTCLAYLWRRDQAELLEEMIETELNAVLIKVAAMGK
jgi:diphthine-ammonia ligase